MPVPAPTNFELINPGFETGTTTGWTVVPFGGSASPTTDTSRPFSGVYAGRWNGGDGSGTSGGIEADWINNARGTVYVGQTISGNIQIALVDTDNSQNRAEARIYWLDASDAVIAVSSGNIIRGNNSSWRQSTVTGVAPAGAVYAAFGVWTTANAQGGSGILIDNAVWDYTYTNSATLLEPADGAIYEVGAPIPLRVQIDTGTSGTTVDSVEYYADAVLIATQVNSPYAINYDQLTAGTYDITAVVTFSDDSQITTDAASIEVTATPPEPITREFKASNSYTYLVGESFTGLASSMPPTATVTGVEVLVDYDLFAQIRSKDKEVSDLSVARYEAFFDMVTGGTFEAILLTKDGTSYVQNGSAITEEIEVVASDFTVFEDGTSESKRYTSLNGPSGSVIVGNDTALFGVTEIASSDFYDKAIGIRFYPTLGTKPEYAAAGDAVLRAFINSLKVRVYFNAGSVEYCFASPDKSQVIRGRLVHSSVFEGDFRTGDATGVLHLAPELVIDSGSTQFIGSNWTIHAGCPPTDANQIGVVGESANGTGMSYSGLPGQAAVLANRSRYEFTVENFYGDESLDSIYGVHGLPRAFAYNGEEFYKIYTQPDATKDMPRHLAYHHTHLALGFGEGRVDISVVGQPYNFDGAFGASSWTIGDKVVGLLPLSGTILGVFGSKSVWGISGTTLDNFATQVITPNIGATEYTITDMGFPVYANSYGVYTLAQVQQYGDYLGTPMSQDISPWIRPRLVRKYTSDKEVVVAWPVRSKNQYRIAFSDGYIATMTLNNGQQGAPTFSFQKYFVTPPDEDPDLGIPLLEYPGMVPVAVSSELDDAGEERIHIADTPPFVEIAPPAVLSGTLDYVSMFPQGIDEFVISAGNGSNFMLDSGCEVATILSIEFVSGTLYGVNSFDEEFNDCNVSLALTGTVEVGPITNFVSEIDDNAIIGTIQYSGSEAAPYYVAEMLLNITTDQGTVSNVLYQALYAPA